MLFILFVLDTGCAYAEFSGFVFVTESLFTAIRGSENGVVSVLVVGLSFGSGIFQVFT